jgi:predicted metal-binding membrane protein
MSAMSGSSMMWMRMPGETWAGVAASFLGMWVVMMSAMMLPSLAPTLWRDWQALTKAGTQRASLLIAIMGVGYFIVWTVVGMAVFPVGATLTAVAMEQPAFARAEPIAIGIVILIGGALQFTSWKARHLVAWQPIAGDHALPIGAGAAWRHGTRLGVHCVYCCAGLTASLLVVGLMDLRAMAVVTAVITIERLAPAGERVARGIGIAVAGAGVAVIARAAGFG